jgi:HlyD family secretion protein
MKTHIGLLLAAALAAPAIGDEERKTQRVRTEPVRRGTLDQAVRAVGSVEPEEVVDVGAQVPGTVARLGADPADPKKAIDYRTPVEKGTVLAELDATPFKLAVDRARAGLEAARADARLKAVQLQVAEREAERLQRLAAARAVSAEELEAGRSRVEVGKATLALAQAAVKQAAVALQEAEANLGYTVLRSPIKGIVIDRRVNAGQTVVARLDAPSLFLIARDLKRMEVWAAVPEADVGQVRKGQTAAVTVAAFPRDRFVGKVTGLRLNAVTDKNRVTYTVVIALDNPDEKLLPYMTAEVQIATGTRPETLLVPNAALSWRPLPDQIDAEAHAALRAWLNTQRRHDEEANVPKRDRGLVWVMEKGRLRPVPLRLRVTDGTRTEVVDGDLAEGAQVAIGQPEPAPGGEKGAR